MVLRKSVILLQLNIKTDTDMKIQDQKFNGKIYGKEGSYSIYVNNEKVDVTDAQVAEYVAYKNEVEDLKNNFPLILDVNKEVKAKAQEIGIIEKGFALTHEQRQAMLSTFEIEVIEGEYNGQKAKIEIAKYKGEALAARASIGGRSMDAPLNQLETLKSQIAA